MTDDLVKRLREAANKRDGFEAVFLSEDAADRIEEADRAIANLQREYDKRGDRIEALERERERLALAICGGEDLPGYANAQPVEALEKVARDNASFASWQIDQTAKAEARLAKAVEALQEIAADDFADVDGIRVYCRAVLAEIGEMK